MDTLEKATHFHRLGRTEDSIRGEVFRFYKDSSSEIIIQKVKHELNGFFAGVKAEKESLEANR